MRAWWLAAVLAAGDPYVELGPMVGHTGSDEALLWVKASGPSRLAVRYGRRPDLADGRLTGGIPLGPDTDFAGHVRVTELEPATRYFYAVFLDGRAATAPPYPSFVTAPRPGMRGRFRFAFGSCVGAKGADAAACWGDMAARTSFDLLLMLGDNHYADSTDPALQRASYWDHRRPAGFREIAARTPTYGIWDDHDYGPNNSDGTAPGKEDSLRTFREFWANPAYGQEDDPGVYFSFSWGDADFFMLDSRTHRTPNRAPDDGTKTMLGARQKEWLKRGLAASRASLKFVACGSEWQTHTQPDGWSSFLRERDEIFGFIRDRGIRGVIFLSGDRHFTAAYQIQGRFLEFTSGPLGSSNARPKEAPEMILCHAEGKLYAVAEADTTGERPAVTLEVYRAGEGLRERRPFTAEEIDGEVRIPPMAWPPERRR
ncbi:MAG TPA: alkaline phosphatase D family protein [Planctomycetota bacterium]|nr:alkaline phosphatase D family protein [Planctomycetota bacterium]